MALTITANWHKPIKLVNDNGFSYTVENLDNIPDKPGVYVFAREHGNTITPIYIGSSLNLRKRIKQQLDKVGLMTKVKDANKGQRILLFCTVKPTQGHKPEKQRRIVENALIAHAIAAGVELVNIQGTKKSRHSINNSGNSSYKKIAQRRMFVDAK